MTRGLHLLLFLTLPAGAAGQDLMNTPIGFRSGFTEGAATTRPGTLTVDAGSSIRWAEGTTTYRFGELNVRAPVSRRVEARIYVNSYAWRRTAGDLASGREDLSVALATMLLTHRGPRPVVALILRLDTPTGGLPGREHSWRPSGRWSLGWELPGGVALHCNLGVARETSSGSRTSVSSPASGYGAGSPAASEPTARPTARPGAPGWAVDRVPARWAHLSGPSLDAPRPAHRPRLIDAGSPRWVGIGVRQRVAR